jgi:hypothetical protein
MFSSSKSNSPKSAASISKKHIFYFMDKQNNIAKKGLLQPQSNLIL